MNKPHAFIAYQHSSGMYYMPIIFGDPWDFIPRGKYSPFPLWPNLPYGAIAVYIIRMRYK